MSIDPELKLSNRFILGNHACGQAWVCVTSGFLVWRDDKHRSLVVDNMRYAMRQVSFEGIHLTLYGLMTHGCYRWFWCVAKLTSKNYSSQPSLDISQVTQNKIKENVVKIQICSLKKAAENYRCVGLGEVVYTHGIPFTNKDYFWLHSWSLDMDNNFITHFKIDVIT